MSWIKKIFGWFKDITNSEVKVKEERIADNISDARDTMLADTQTIDSLTETYQNALEELKNQASKAKDEINRAKDKFNEIKEDVADTKKLVVLGFWLIIIMVVGVFIGYWINAISKSDLSWKMAEFVEKQNQKISEINMEINNLKNQVENLKIRNYLR